MRNIYLAKCFLLGIAALAAAPPQATEFAPLYTKAEDLYKNQKYSEALAAFSEALKRALEKEEKAYSLYYIALVQRALGNNDLYLERLNDSLKEFETPEARKEFLSAQAESTAPIMKADDVKDYIIRARKVDLQILFETGKGQLNRQGADQTAELARALNSAELAGNRFLVLGHTDTTGSAELNWKLSAERARAVRLRLIELGVTENRLTSEGKGQSELKVNPETNAADRAKNRRVEVKLL